MPSGQCLCGAVKVTISGEPVAVGMCHCLGCRRKSGSTHSLNWFVPENQVEVKGEPKTFLLKANSGNYITSYFCPTCRTTLFREGPALPGIKFVKAGILDDPKLLDTAKPQGEIFVSRRVGWMSPIPGAYQKEEM